MFFSNPISSTVLVESIKIESSVPRFPEGLSDPDIEVENVSSRRKIDIEVENVSPRRKIDIEVKNVTSRQ